MSNKVECPYCDFENEITDIESNSFDFECQSCEKEFEVEVEYEPSLSAIEIIWVDCQACGTETRNPYRKDRVFPFPQIGHDCVCEKCWKAGLAKEWEAGRDVQDR
ncbi:hypothetical protein ACX93W_26805 [Paenibacillus sp. CAU 1782]